MSADWVEQPNTDHDREWAQRAPIRDGFRTRRRRNFISVSLEQQSESERKKAVWCGKSCRVVVRRE